MRRKHPRSSPGPDQGIAEGQCVHHGREHAHVVPGDPVESRSRKFSATHQVAAAHHHGNIRAGRRHFRDIGSRPCKDSRVYANAGRASEGLAGEFQEHARDWLAIETVLAGHQRVSVALLGLLGVSVHRLSTVRSRGTRPDASTAPRLLAATMVLGFTPMRKSTG